MANSKENAEVVQNSDDICCVGPADIARLKQQALTNERKRIRLNLHRSMDDALHEMLIVHYRGSYFQPHRHPEKSESFHMIEGRLSIVVFDEHGEVLQVIKMGDHTTDRVFCYRLAPNYWHTVLPESEVVVFHETTNGPFTPEGREFAPWAPAEESSDGPSYLEALQAKIA